MPKKFEGQVKSPLFSIVCLALMLGACAPLPTTEQANGAVLTLRSFENWAWALAIVLIWADLVLPVPQTAVIAALGIIYGTIVGGLIGSVALISSGLIGYFLMRTGFRRHVQRFVRPDVLERMERLFDQGGAWAIVFSRSLSHSIPEAMVFLAGLAGMPIRRFVTALTLGSVPAAFAFAAIGAGWADQPIVALIVSFVIPILLLPIALYVMRRGARPK